MFETAAALPDPFASSSFSRREDSERTMEHYLRTYPRKRRGDSRQNLPRTEYISTREVTDRVAETLEPFSAKEVAAASGASVKAAQNSREGLNAMSLAHFLNACRAIPELRALAMELMGCETVVDPDFVRGISLLQNALARRSE